MRNCLTLEKSGGVLDNNHSDSLVLVLFFFFFKNSSACEHNFFIHVRGKNASINVSKIRDLGNWSQ